MNSKALGAEVSGSLGVLQTSAMEVSIHIYHVSFN
jgi:hypothetical protein